MSPRRSHRPPVPPGLKLLTGGLALFTTVALATSLISWEPPLVEVPMEYPSPIFARTPIPLPEWPNLAPPPAPPSPPLIDITGLLRSGLERFDLPVPAALAPAPTPGHGPPPVLVPVGSDTNLALGRPVRSSTTFPLIGSLEIITNGNIGHGYDNLVEIGPDHAWIEIDLGAEYRVDGLHIFRFTDHTSAAYRATVIEIDTQPHPGIPPTGPDTASTAVVVHNSDDLNSIGLGTGNHRAYVEPHYGHYMRIKPVVGRYVRIHTHGNACDPLTRYREIKVYGAAVSR